MFTILLEGLTKLNIKMIVTDLDGTLLREDKTISERSLSALGYCRTKGIKLAYATGRGESSKILAPSELFDGFVRVNGATAHVGDTLIYEKLISSESVRDLLIAADRAGVKIAAERNGVHHANFNVTKEWTWIQHYVDADFNTLDIEIEKIFALVDSPEVPKQISRHLTPGLYLNVSRDDMAMVMHEDAVKSKAVAALAEHWGIKQSEIVAFGDDTNDIDLLKYCGVAVAMGNALDEIKTVSDHICDINDNDGLAKWLEENVM